VVSLNIQYKKSVTYPEKVKVKTWVSKFSKLRSRYQYEIYNEKDEIVTTGYTDNVIVTKENNNPVRLDKAFPNWYEIYHSVNEPTRQAEISYAVFCLKKQNKTYPYHCRDCFHHTLISYRFLCLLIIKPYLPSFHLHFSCISQLCVTVPERSQSQSQLL
ncbi:acyl-CoA thioesterase, partial [Streptococcus suis]